MVQECPERQESSFERKKKAFCDLIRDSITTEIMKDAVVNAQSGKTYDQGLFCNDFCLKPTMYLFVLVAITEWLVEYGNTDPETRTVTHVDDLVPNWTVRHIIDLFGRECQ